ncbi:hypothetical protein CCP3SC1_890002 [Gammaproteobacteria bacterium]
MKAQVPAQAKQTQQPAAAQTATVQAASGGLEFIDNRPEAVAQRKLMEAICNSPHVHQLQAFAEQINNSPVIAAQRKQLASIFGAALQWKDPVPVRNNTGLPDDLKSGVEALSGISMDDVQVHYNS